ncbi:hypothetical protein HNR23_002877 [Nocardiopsis mwathae]|uniref:Uncharacterized protein n=1 Tax=Nocardiopsis mwathae TaxID=1472723 RepID=A0A7X0D5U2_9ACTN|nr:hypothetical protein [Nocardiopsis mwathae]
MEKAPRAIREVLLPEEAGDFDREYRQVMADAKEQLDLTPVFECLDRWWVVAMSTAQDPEGHRQMLETADRINRGERVSGTPWSVLKAELGL